MAGASTGDGGRNDQDQWLAAFLTAEPSIAATAAGLTLQTATTTVTFVDERIAQPDLPLVGTAWNVEYTVDAATGTVAFGPLALTRRACPDGGTDVERAIVTVLAGTATYAINGPMMELRAKSRGLGLRGPTS